jgi:hypothetical protein
MSLQAKFSASRQQRNAKGPTWSSAEHPRSLFSKSNCGTGGGPQGSITKWAISQTGSFRVLQGSRTPLLTRACLKSSGGRPACRRGWSLAVRENRCCSVRVHILRELAAGRRPFRRAGSHGSMSAKMADATISKQALTFLGAIAAGFVAKPSQFQMT